MNSEIIKKGKILKNIYEVDCLIGQGAFGEVYRVKHKFLGYQALKILKNTGVDPQDFMNLSTMRILEALLSKF